MKLERLHISGFLSHGDTELSLSRLSVLRGLNGSGKSSVEQAIEMLLCGKSDSTDERGAGSRDLIRKGSSKAVIEADIEDGGEMRHLRCSITEKSGRSVTATKGNEPCSDYLGYLGLNSAVLSALINGRRFVDMAPAKQKELLAAIILPSRYDWPEWVKDAVSKTKLGLDWSKEPFAFIDEGYKNSYSERTVVNRQLKEWRAPEVPPAPSLPIEEIRARLKERQDMRTSIALEKQKAEDAVRRAQQAANARQAKAAELESRLSAERANVNAVAERVLTEPKKKELKKIAQGDAKAQEIEREISALNGRIAELKEQTASLASLANSPQCPTCQQAITVEILNGIIAPLSKELSDSQAKVSVLYHQRKSIGDFEDAKRRLADAEEAEKDLEVAHRRVREIEKMVEENAGAIEASIPEIPDFSQQFAEIDARIEKGSAVLQAAVAYESAHAAAQKAESQRKELESRQALLEKLVEYFGPNGVKAELLQNHIGGFVERMNAVLGKWGFEAHLSFEPYEFGVRFAGAEAAYPLRTISKSQRYRFACAFQIALAQVSGFRFAVIDGADILDDAGRQMLYAALQGAAMDQVIVTQTDSRTTVPKATDAAFYMFGLQQQNGIPMTAVQRL